MPKVKCALLKMDEQIYPRQIINLHHVRELEEALHADAVFPPIVVDRKTKKIVDGWHRCEAMKRVFGDGAEIDVIWKTYKSKREMLLDAIAMNSHHGRGLPNADKVHCLHIAIEMGISVEVTAKALSIQKVTADMMLETKTVFGAGNVRVAAKRTIGHLAGKKLNKRQLETNRKCNGMSQSYHVNILIDLIESKCLDTENERLMERLAHLGALIVDMKLEGWLITSGVAQPDQAARGLAAQT